MTVKSGKRGPVNATYPVAIDKDHLADFYRRGANNGMPLDVWDPKYIPVGLSR